MNIVFEDFLFFYSHSKNLEEFCQVRDKLAAIELERLKTNQEKDLLQAQ